MLINSSTKIDRILDHNKEAIDVIVAINPHFKKLKNPLLRKILASRVSIEDAAKIGKCEVQDFFDALSKIGFEIEENNTKKQEEMTAPNEIILQKIKEKKVHTLDVRKQLEQGSDPFKTIMGEMRNVPQGYVLELINTFEPKPLITILSKKGYQTYVKETDGLIITYFLKTSDKEQKSEPLILQKVTLDELEKVKNNFEVKEIDVRDMEMPQPMVTILNEVENLDKNEALFVNHKKVPQYLLPELKDRNLTTLIAEIDENNVKLLIHY